MSVRIINREYFNQYSPLNETPPDWLLGNAGDWMTMRLTCEAGIDFIPTQTNPLQHSLEERSIKLMNGKKWGDYGFDINRTIKFIYSKTTTPDDGEPTTETLNIDLEIENIFNDTLIYADNAEMVELGQYETIPTDRGDIRIHGIYLFDDRELEGARLKYTNIENSQVESHTLNSFIDGTVTEAILAGINNDAPGFQNMQLIGLQSGMSINSVKIKKDTAAGDNNAVFSYPNNVFRIDVEPFTVKRGVCQPLTRTSGSNPPFQNTVESYYNMDTSTADGSYLTGNADQMFILNADFTGVRAANIMSTTTITNNDNGGNNRRLKMILYKYTGGTDLNYVSKSTIVEWPVSSSTFGTPHVFNDTVNIDVTPGDSYSIGYEYEFDNITLAQRSVTFNSTWYMVLDELVGDGGYKRKYTIDVNFMLSSFWDNPEDMMNKIAPNVVFNAASLTDSIGLSFYPEWNNPNVITQNDPSETERLGNTGWFGENFNQLPNHFSITGLQYLDGGGFSVPALSFASETKIRATISGIPNLTMDSKFTYGFGWIASDESQYKEKTTPFHKNIKLNSPFNTRFDLGTNYPFTFPGFSEDGLARIDVHDVSFMQSGTDVVFEATFKPTPEFTMFFNNLPDDRQYFIWVSAADAELSPFNFTDRVNLIVDTNTMEYFVPIEGELPNVSTSFIEHPESEIVAGAPLYKGFLEDDILCRSFFPLNAGDRLNQIIIGFEVQNTVTGQTFELDRYGAALTQYITDVNGVQQIDFQNERGFKFIDGFNKNWVRIIRNSNNDAPADATAGTPATSGYQLLFGAKIRWEYWIAKQNVPVEFFNASEPLNGFHNNWLAYLRAGQHIVNFFIIFDVNSGGEVSRYKNAFEISFDNYDENAGITTDHKYFKDSTNEQMSVGTDAETGRPVGVLLSNENTRIEITYTHAVGEFDLSNLYCVTTLEIDGGPGVMQHRQLSSIIGSEYDNVLIPVSGATKLKVEQPAPNVIKTTCLVDYSRLSPAYRYKITGRIGCFAHTDGEANPAGKYEPRYESKYE